MAKLGSLTKALISIGLAAGSTFSKGKVQDGLMKTSEILEETNALDYVEETLNNDDHPMNDLADEIAAKNHIIEGKDMEIKALKSQIAKLSKKVNELTAKLAAKK